MQYRKNRKGEPVSMLGYGCMRFSRKGPNIDFEKAERELLRAYELGVNYFDTAYIYPGSEDVLGRVLEKNHLRDKVNIATKLPQYMMKTAGQIERTFNEELKRLRTDHFDYYLMHMFTDIGEWEKLKKLGVENFIREKKESGAIRNIGFSFHGNTEMFLKILNAYDWDFCQIQYNYLDETTQAGVVGLKAAAARGIPVVIMEPLRGGKLVNKLPEAAKQLMARHERGWSPADWGLRWLWDQPEVTVVLSGMNSLAMVEENVRIASEAAVGAFSAEDRAFLQRILGIIREKEKVGCTGCRYCMPCPKGVDIPGYFSSYNLMYTESKVSGWRHFFQAVALSAEPSFASQCVQCGKCEKHCPQAIPIREQLKKAEKALLPWPVKLAVKMGRRFMFGRR